MLTVLNYIDTIMDALRQIPDAYVSTEQIQQDIADPVWNGVNSITLITGDLNPINTLNAGTIGYSTQIIVRCISDTNDNAVKLARIAAAVVRAAIPINTLTDGNTAIARVSDSNNAPFGWRVSVGFNLHVKNSI